MLKDLFGGLTLKPLPSKPRRVLDLGCGGGTWILEAAKEWPVRLQAFYPRTVHADRHLLQDAIFVGFDVHQRQPNLARAARYNAGLADLVRRIHWVHGNLYVRFSTRFLASVVPDLDLPLQIGVAITTMFTRLLYPCDKR